MASKTEGIVRTLLLQLGEIKLVKAPRRSYPIIKMRDNIGGTCKFVSGLLSFPRRRDTVWQLSFVFVTRSSTGFISIGVKGGATAGQGGAV